MAGASSMSLLGHHEISGSSLSGLARQAAHQGIAVLKKAGTDHLELPKSIKVLCADGSVKEEVLGNADKLAVMRYLPSPPGGWYGQLGFFRLVSYAFLAVSIFGGVLAVLSLTDDDGFAFFASVLLTLAAAVSAAAAYSHEGLANEVTQVAKQNDQLAEKNDRMAEQLKELDSVASRLKDLEASLGCNMDQLKATLDKLHWQTTMQQLETLLRAFCAADRDGIANQRLENSEVEDFLDVSKDILESACPTFKLEAFQEAANSVGIDMHAMRFMVNAVIASGDQNPHKSKAQLSLIMFAFSPEEHLESFLGDLKLVCHDKDEDQLRSLLLQMKERYALPAQSGPIPCRDLETISRMIMSVVEAPPPEAGGGDGGEGQQLG